MTGRDRASSGWLAFAGFTVGYAVLALVARSTVVDADGPTSLVWPASGLAVLWVLAESPRVGTARALVGIGAVQALVMLATGATPFFSLVTVLACVTQAWAVAVLVRRYCPSLLGAGGVDSVHEPAVLARGTFCAAAGTLAGALIGGIGLAIETGAWEWSPFVTWFGRTFAGLVVVGATGHLIWERVRSGGRLDLGTGRRSELALMVALLVAILVVGYEEKLPLAFIVVALCVWTALRFETVIGAAYTTLAAAGVARLAFHGHSLFEASISPEGQALITQGFVLTVLFTSLIIGTIRDERVSVIAQLEASERELTNRGLLLDSMTESMTEGIAVVDASGRIVRVNAAARRLIGATETSDASAAGAIRLRRTDGVDLTPEEHPSAVAMVEHRVVTQDVVVPLADGTGRILAVTSAPISRPAAPPGVDVGVVSVYRDVTEERRHSRMLADFASTAAHDLRSPLTAVRGWLDLATAKLDNPDDALRALDRARGGVQRMQSLITDLLRQALVEGGDLSPEPLVLGGEGGLVEEVTLDLAEDADVVAAEDIPVVCADPDLVRQLLSNLIGNALKYVADDRDPQVVVTGRVRGDRVVIDVTDNGIGIPAEARSLVFERFHRAHADDERFSGTGLGLAICRTVVERHGGRIRAVPAPHGTGTTFRFDLPRATAS